MKKYKFKIISISIIVISCGFTAYFSSGQKYYAKKLPSIDPATKYIVQKVMDGDTFVVKIEKQFVTVRMLGIDTPETVDPRKPVQCFGKEASKKTKEILLKHSVTLQTDPTQGLTDKYNRLLAYIFVDDLFLNEYLLKNGFAREYTYEKPYQKQVEFKDIAKQAQQAKLGLWSSCSSI